MFPSKRIIGKNTVTNIPVVAAGVYFDGYIQIQLATRLAQLACQYCDNIVTMLLQCWANVVAKLLANVVTMFMCRHLTAFQQCCESTLPQH